MCEDPLFKGIKVSVYCITGDTDEDNVKVLTLTLSELGKKEYKHFCLRSHFETVLFIKEIKGNAKLKKVSLNIYNF